MGGFVEATSSEYSEADIEEDGDEDSEEEEADSNNISATQTGPFAVQGVATGPRFSSIIVGNPASVLTQYQNWQYQRPLATPLGFQVPSDSNGGVTTFTLVGNVDFNNRNSVSKANEYTRQRKERARIRHGLPPLRPSLADREMTQAQRNILVSQYHTCAAANGNRRIPNPELTRRFNAQFQETPPRTDLSIANYVNRKLKDVKETYIGRQRPRR